MEYETDLLFYDISIIPGQTRLVGLQFQKEWVPLPAVKAMQYRARINLVVKNLDEMTQLNSCLLLKDHTHRLVKLGIHIYICRLQ